jgi:UDP-GlcNAc:undecaprenyl-phosphate/decaprenyl-phosphate GlcNAc-1-phosphate transferase
VTLDQAMTMFFGAGIGFAVAGLLAQVRLKAPPKQLMRVNFRGREVPAVLGGPLCMGALLGLLCIAILDAVGDEAARTGRVAAAVAAGVVVMYLAGSWDDRRGDERPRGFSGHFGAARSRRLTGGIVKLVAGAVAGIACGLILAWLPPGIYVRGAIEVALIIPLSANLVNLLDRAPGRALKFAGLAMLVLLAFAHESWAVAAAPMVGAMAACFGPDLRERGMLGDAGANPIGAVLGLGLVMTLHSSYFWLVIVILLALNLASEKWSFSRAIESTPGLREFDRLGREGSPPK